MGIVYKFLLCICLLLSVWTMRAFAQAPAETAKSPAGSPAPKADATETAEPARKSAVGSATVSKDQTSVNFEETLLEGKMKAPAGTFLQGRKDQHKNQMVQLRKNFRRELKRSKGGVRALTD